MASGLRLLLDLGDLLTKGMLVEADDQRRFGFPSIVATRLVDREAELGALVTDPRRAPPRLIGFDAAAYPRLRSFPDSPPLAGARGVSGARYAGWLAAAYGADRQLLGDHPTTDNVDVLVRKALMKSGLRHGDVEVVFLVDVGAKSAAITRYAQAMPRSVAFLSRTVEEGEPVPVRVALRARLVDAAVCALAALPPELAVDQVGRILLVDVGYLRTKLAVLSAAGCERQEQVDAAGISSCVTRVLRDGQEVGLIEDEIAVIKALEQSRGRLEVAGRRFDIGASLADARRALAGDLARAVERLAIEQYQSQGDSCRTVAIVGGGAAVVGAALAERLAAAEVGFETVWICPDTRFLHLAGAHRLIAGGGSLASS